MNKSETGVDPDFLPHSDKLAELQHMYEQKADEYVAARMAGNDELAEKIKEDQKHMLIELRMLNPNIKISEFEENLIEEAKDETFLYQQKLNKKPNEWSN